MLLQTVLMLERRRRPTRGEIDEAALMLLARHGAQILATARRYAANADDADDAYQRGLEILLTKAPTTSEAELVPWLKTVVKHEAFALRRQRERLTPLTGDGEPVEHGTGPATTHEQAERYERLAQSAEALRRLKPQEVRCLVLRAQGLSYREICQATGFTYTKVNRCLTEGRQALAGRLAGIESGVECAQLAPLLSLLADGEADARALARLRPHLKTCLACRARLREYRAAPTRVAALLPVTLVGADRSPGGLDALIGAAQQKAEALLGAAQQKIATLGERAHAAVELAAGQKVAALAASAAALAGGGVAADQFANHQGPPRPTVAQQAPPSETAQTVTTEASPAPPPVTTEQTGTPEQSTQPALAPSPETPPPPPPDPANEFAPASASASPSPTATPPSEPTPTPPQTPPAPTSARPAPPTAGGQSEFAP